MQGLVVRDEDCLADLAGVEQIVVLWRLVEAYSVLDELAEQRTIRLEDFEGGGEESAN